MPYAICHMPYAIYHIPYTIYHIPYTIYQEQKLEVKAMEEEMPEGAAAPDTHDGFAEELLSVAVEQQQLLAEAEPEQHAPSDDIVAKARTLLQEMRQEPEQSAPSHSIVASFVKDEDMPLPESESKDEDAKVSKKQRTGTLDGDYGFILPKMSPPPPHVETAKQTLLPGASQPKPPAEGPKRGFSLAYLRKTPVKLEGITVMEEFIREQVQPFIDDSYKVSMCRNQQNYCNFVLLG